MLHQIISDLFLEGQTPALDLFFRSKKEKQYVTRYGLIKKNIR